MRFRRLAEERLADRYRVRALDLRGHGRSGWDEPWTIPQHVEDVLESVSEPTTWIGHSFGGRLTAEVTARRPELVDRAILLDPALWVPPDFAEEIAEGELAKTPFASREEALQARAAGQESTPTAFLEEEMDEHLVEQPDGGFFYRYSRETVAAAFREMSTPPPAWESLRVPTLLVVAEHAKLVSAAEVELYRAALGELLRVVVVPGGHIVLWDAYEETAAAIDRFLD
jgi:lipase